MRRKKRRMSKMRSRVRTIMVAMPTKKRRRKRYTSNDGILGLGFLGL